jgi:hypothetical protein
VNSEQKSIGDIAYELWHARGCPHGSPEIDWHAAELQRSTQSSSIEPTALEAKIDESELGSFPASDPPASHGTDHPPSNADAKWKAAGLNRESANRLSARRK